MAKGETYKQFVDKFKPKQTTDDCYTPGPVYNAVLKWAAKEYGFEPNRAVRPFWPGGITKATTISQALLWLITRHLAF